MQRGLVRNGASQERVLVLCLGSEGGEGAQRRRAEVAANTELVAGRRLGLGLAAGHRVTTAASGAAVLPTLTRANMHSTASRTDKASTAGKSPMNPEATPTPTTGMMRPP